MRAQTAVLAWAAVAIAGCLSSAPLAVPDGGDAAADVGPLAVVAFIDTGINPYHSSFREESALGTMDPASYIAGYPSGAIPLHLTFDAPDYWSAVRADCERVWKTIQAGTLYWFPGTKIVGAVAPEGANTIDCAAEEPTGAPILDAAGHGTMVASKGASVDYGSCKACRIVSIQGMGVPSLEWSAANAHWLDAVSNSWGPNPVPVPDGVPNDQVAGESQSFMRAVEDAAQKNLHLWASSNGIFGAFGVLGHPTLLRMKLPPSVVMVGAHDSGYVTIWHGFPPHVVSDGCDDWAADHQHLSESRPDIGGGTSSATPYVAGAAGQILLDARALMDAPGVGIRDGIAAKGTRLAADGPLSDGEFSVAEWREVLLKTAVERPGTQWEDGPPCQGTVTYDPLPVLWRDVPDEVPEYLLIGYGSVDNESLALARQVLAGAAPMPDRSETDAFFARDDAARRQVYDLFAGER